MISVSDQYGSESVMSRFIRKPAFCICKTKFQISCAVTADQCLCFGYADGKIPLLPKSVAVHPGL